MKTNPVLYCGLILFVSTIIGMPGAGLYLCNALSGGACPTHYPGIVRQSEEAR